MGSVISRIVYGCVVVRDGHVMGMGAHSLEWEGAKIYILLCPSARVVSHHMSLSVDDSTIYSNSAAQTSGNWMSLIVPNTELSGGEGHKITHPNITNLQVTIYRNLQYAWYAARRTLGILI